MLLMKMRIYLVCSFVNTKLETNMFIKVNLMFFFRLPILSNFPETLSPSQYIDLLPEVRWDVW